MKTLAGAPPALFQRLSNTYAFVRNPGARVGGGGRLGRRQGLSSRR